MARHEAMLRAAAEALRPSLRFAALVEARRQAVAAQSGAEGYNLLHLRVEKDWLALCEWWQNPAEGRDNCMNNTATVGRQLRRLGFAREVGAGRGRAGCVLTAPLSMQGLLACWSRAGPCSPEAHAWPAFASSSTALACAARHQTARAAPAGFPSRVSLCN